MPQLVLALLSLTLLGTLIYMGYTGALPGLFRDFNRRVLARLPT